MTEDEIGLLTMRKLHLLIAEWRMAQRLHDERTHKLMCALGWKPGEGAEVTDVFPTMADEPRESAADDAPAEEDDGVIFREPADACGI